MINFENMQCKIVSENVLGFSHYSKSKTAWAIHKREGTVFPHWFDFSACNYSHRHMKSLTLTAAEPLRSCSYLILLISCKWINRLVCGILWSRCVAGHSRYIIAAWELKSLSVINITSDLRGGGQAQLCFNWTAEQVSPGASSQCPQHILCVVVIWSDFQTTLA